MKRGDIYYGQLDPTLGDEIKKMRPVLILSNNLCNYHSTLVTVVPLSTNISKIYPFEVFISSKKSNLQKDSKILCQQIRTISQKRIMGEKIGGLNKEQMLEVEAGVKLHLDFL